MTAMAAPARFDMGRVLSRLFAVLGRNFVTFLLLALLLVGVPAALTGLTSLVYRAVPATGFQPFTIATGLGAALISLCANAVLQGAVIHATVGDLAGRPASFADCVSTGLRYILPLLGIGIISGIGIGAATLLLIVPGILLALAWSVASPAEVVEQTGVFGALGRSIALTRNHRGAIFVLALMYFAVTLIVGMGQAAVGVALLAGGANLATIAARSVVNALAQSATSMVSSAGVASIYYELRQIKDGVGASELAAVFD